MRGTMQTHGASWPCMRTVAGVAGRSVAMYLMFSPLTIS